jgi:hypothetical protein
MIDARAGTPIQAWLESTAQGHLLGTEYGHLPGDREPAWLLRDAGLRARAIESTLELAANERCARDVGAALAAAAPDAAARVEVASQVLDETRHLEVMERRLEELGAGADRVAAGARDPLCASLRRASRVLLDAIERRDFAAGLFGLNVLYAPVALQLLEHVHAAQAGLNPKFERTLAGVIADERRHVRSGEERVRTLLRHDPGAQQRLEGIARGLVPCLLAVAAQQSVVMLERAALVEAIALRLGHLGLRATAWEES